MSLFLFIRSNKRRYNAFSEIKDLDIQQRIEALNDTLQLWSEKFPRENLDGTAKLLNGSTQILLPPNFLKRGADPSQPNPGLGGLVSVGFGLYLATQNYSYIFRGTDSDMNSTFFPPS